LDNIPPSAIIKNTMKTCANSIRFGIVGDPLASETSLLMVVKKTRKYADDITPEDFPPKWTQAISFLFAANTSVYEPGKKHWE
jgi:hypothetical protein